MSRERRRHSLGPRTMSINETRPYPSCQYPIPLARPPRSFAVSFFLRVLSSIPFASTARGKTKNSILLNTTHWWVSTCCSLKSSLKWVEYSLNKEFVSHPLLCLFSLFVWLAIYLYISLSLSLSLWLSLHLYVALPSYFPFLPCYLSPLLSLSPSLPPSSLAMQLPILKEPLVEPRHPSWRTPCQRDNVQLISSGHHITWDVLRQHPFPFFLSVPYTRSSHCSISSSKNWSFSFSVLPSNELLSVTYR